MNHFFPRTGSNKQQTGGFLANVQILIDRLINWLVGFIKLTEEEQKDAGIFYPGNQRDK
jgi:hypothetical protein